MSDKALTGRSWHDDVLGVTFTVTGYAGEGEYGSLYEVTASDSMKPVRMYESVIRRHALAHAGERL
jgi:hypothetical protein